MLLQAKAGCSCPVTVQKESPDSLPHHVYSAVGHLVLSSACPSSRALRTPETGGKSEKLQSRDAGI